MFFVLPMLNPVPLPIPFYATFVAPFCCFVLVKHALFVGKINTIEAEIDSNHWLLGRAVIGRMPHFFLLHYRIVYSICMSFNCFFLAIPFPPFVLATNFIPSLSIAFGCLAFIRKDGLYLLLSKFLSLISFLYLVLMIVFAGFFYEKFSHNLDYFFAVKDEESAFLNEGRKTAFEFNSLNVKNDFTELRNWHQLIHISQLAYLQNKERRTSAFKEIGFSSVQDFTSLVTGVFCSVLSAEKIPQVVVVCRGTHELRDLFFDFQSTGKSWDKFGLQGLVHKGFALQTESVLEELHAYVQKPELFKKDFIFTGHSLGGANALLIAAATKIATNISVVTFAQPKVGNKEFAKSIESKFLQNGISYTSIYSNSDIVAYVPPSLQSQTTVKKVAGKWIGYLPKDIYNSNIDFVHFGKRIEISPEKDLKFVEISELSIEEESFWKDFEAETENAGKFVFLESLWKRLQLHFPQKYSYVLKQQVKIEQERLYGKK